MTLRVFAVRDYDAMHVDLIFPTSGEEGSEAWPPPEREILIERSALAVLGARVGDTLRIELPGGRVRHLRIAGLAHDMVQVPAQFDGTPYGYIVFETLTWFSEPYGFNELHVRVTPPLNPPHRGGRTVFPTSGGSYLPPSGGAKGGSRAAVNTVKDKAEQNGFTIPLSLTVEPGTLPLDDILDAVLLLMGALGVLALFLSVFLILNTVSALLAQQKRQIGVMKAIGARTGQIMGMYLTLALLYGLCALLVAVPLSGVGARALSAFIAGMFNFDLLEVRLPPTAMIIQIAVGVLVPLLASLPPFLANLRVTAAEALRVGYQSGKGSLGAGWIDRLLSGTNLWFARHTLRRPLLLSLRNTFRSKGRLVLTLITLTLGGAIFMGVFSVQASLDQTLNDLLCWWGFDVLVIPARPYRADKMIQAALDVPGVVAADVWFQLPARRVRPNGVESDNLYFFVPHPGSPLVPSPKMLAGRWLLPEDENAVVLNALAMKEEPDTEVGSEIVLKIMGRERTYRVVGVCMGILMPMGYAPYPYVARTTGQVGLGGAALIQLEHHDTDTIAATAAALEAHFERVGLRVSATQTVNGGREEAGTSFGIIIALLMVMAVLLALVGGLGLMESMSINVLERAPIGAQIAAAQANVQTTLAQRDAVQAQLDLARSGATAATIAVAEAAVREAEVALAAARTLLADLTLAAPFDAVVSDTAVHPADVVAPGNALVTLATLDALHVRAKDLSELDIARVTEGQPVRITFDARPDAAFPGRVTRIDRQGQDYLGDVIYPVFIELDAMPDWAMWGMTANCEVQMANGEWQTANQPINNQPINNPIIIAEAVIEPERWAEARFSIPSKVVEVVAQPGMRVEAGDVLARLDATHVAAAVRQAEATLATAQAGLALAQAGPRPEAIAAAEAQVAAAEGDVARAIALRNQWTVAGRNAQVAAVRAQLEAAQAEKRQLEAQWQWANNGGDDKRAQTLREQIAVVEQKIAAAETRLAAIPRVFAAQAQAADAGVHVAEAQFAAAQAELALTQAGPRAEEVAAAQAAVRQAEAALAAAQVALTHTELRAPFAGTVTQVYVETGDIVTPERPVVVLATLDRLRVRTRDVLENDVSYVSVGQAVTVEVDALPETAFAGRVAQIEPQGVLYRGDVAFPVIIALDTPSPMLLWVMKAVVEITP